MTSGLRLSGADILFSVWYLKYYCLNKKMLFFVLVDTKKPCTVYEDLEFFSLPNLYLIPARNACTLGFSVYLGLSPWKHLSDYHLCSHIFIWLLVTPFSHITLLCNFFFIDV